MTLKICNLFTSLCNFPFYEFYLKFKLRSNGDDDVDDDNDAQTHKK